jgi:ribonuclease VapC
LIIDTSAFLAILFDEPERAGFNAEIAKAETRLASSAALLETSIVLYAKAGDAALREFDLFIKTAGISFMEFDLEQALLARQAYLRFGKGRHAAALNFGDCFSYALAKKMNQPLLCKGYHFRETDLDLCFK